MTDDVTALVSYLALDEIEGLALDQAIERLPAMATTAGAEPLTPSLRGVFDRFLSVPLRNRLRSLRVIGGPAALVVDGLGIGTQTTTPVHRDRLTLALVAWLIEASGLFPATGQTMFDGSTSSCRQHHSDHVLLLIDAAPIKTDSVIELQTVDGSTNKVGIEILPHRVLLIDRRRLSVAFDHPDASEGDGWLLSYDLVIDPWSNRRRPGKQPDGGRS